MQRQNSPMFLIFGTDVYKVAPPKIHIIFGKILDTFVAHLAISFKNTFAYLICYKLRRLQWYPQYAKWVDVNRALSMFY